MSHRGGRHAFPPRPAAARLDGDGAPFPGGSGLGGGLSCGHEDGVHLAWGDLGILVGSLRLGPASPHLVNGLIGALPWTTTCLVAQGLCLSAVLLILALRESDAPFARTAFRLFDTGEAGRSRRLRLASTCHRGHRYELYPL